MNKKRYIDYHEDLMQELQDPQEAQEYINAALQDEDERVFLLALKDVLEAQGGNVSWLSKKTKLNRENLYRLLSKKGNPKLTSLKSILNAIGLELAVQIPKK
jgi:probable addiction module antidote protein